jgi:hypothetical protein
MGDGPLPYRIQTGDEQLVVQDTGYSPGNSPDH